MEKNFQKVLISRSAAVVFMHAAALALQQMLQGCGGKQSYVYIHGSSPKCTLVHYIKLHAEVAQIWFFCLQETKIGFFSRTCEQTKFDFFISDQGRLHMCPRYDSYLISGCVTAVRSEFMCLCLFFISHFAVHAHIACHCHSLSAPHCW